MRWIFSQVIAAAQMPFTCTPTTTSIALPHLAEADEDDNNRRYRSRAIR